MNVSERKDTRLNEDRRTILESRKGLPIVLVKQQVKANKQKLEQEKDEKEKNSRTDAHFRTTCLYVQYTEPVY